MDSSIVLSRWVVKVDATGGILYQILRSLNSRKSNDDFLRLGAQIAEKILDQCPWSAQSLTQEGHIDQSWFPYKVKKHIKVFVNRTNTNNSLKRTKNNNCLLFPIH